jgi:hypothetical protein
MLAHAGGAATLDAPTWLLAYAAATLVLLTTAGLRGRVGAPAAPAGPGPAPARRDDRHDPDEGRPAAGGGDRGPGAVAAPARSWGTVGLVCGRAVGLGTLLLVVAAALLGADASGANLAPSAVLTVWWVGLPLACVVAGDVMAWIDPFGTLARLVPRRARPEGPGPTRPVPDRPTSAAAVPVTRWTAAVLLGAFAWWTLAFHDARSPRALGWFLVAYTAVAVAGAMVWGPAWLRRGEGFGALSSALADARRAGVGRIRPGEGGAAAAGLVPLVAVWLGAVVFDLFSGTRAWVELAGVAGGWERTARASACLAAAVVLAWGAVAGTAWLAGGRVPSPTGRRAVVRAAGLAWLAATTGAFLAHGLTLLLVDGQLALALASDPFGRGWDLLGTATRTIDYSPLSTGLVGTLQLALAAGGAVGGVAAAAAVLRDASADLDVRARLRALWTVGVVLAVAAAAVVAVMASDLE